MGTSATGVCRLCGEVKALTKEHLPPIGAFRGRPHHVEVLHGEAAFFGGKAVPYQHGYHAPVLCEDCNRLTGSWYGGEYTLWTKWGLEILEKRALGESSLPPFRGRLGRVVKQVVCTLIASSQPEFGARNQHLRDYVRERDSKLPADALKLAIYLSPTSTGRSTGVAGATNVDGRIHVMIEMAHIPFGYVLTLSGEPLDTRPVSIGHLAALGYDEEVELDLPMIPVLETHLAFPGDYRTRAEIRLDLIRNILEENDHPSAAAEASRIIASGEAKDFLARHGEDF